jgi:hypothetical protein
VASNPPQLSPPGVAPYAPPTARERRSQAVHRLQVGIVGLGAMLLLVGLANIIMDRARESDVAADAAPAAAGQASGAGDPLAELGVIPSADPEPGQAPAAGAGAGR